MHKAQHYITQDDKKVKCVLCPHNCLVNINNTGKCNVRSNQSGKLYSENYGKVTALGCDPVEKKPLYHFFPGKQILSLGSFGCNLKCVFCQNYNISQAHGYKKCDSKDFIPDDIIKKAKNSHDCCGIAYTYNEPVTWYEFMIETAKQNKNEGFANTVISNGYINPKPLDELLNYIDGFNIDLKAFTDHFYRKHTGASIDPIIKNLKKISRKNIHLEITNLVIPGLNDDTKHFQQMVTWIADELGIDTPLHISRYFPSYKLDISPTPRETICKLRDIALNKLNFVYCGNISLSSGGSDTTCPGCNTTVIKRQGYSTFIKFINNTGHCTKCNYKIAKCTLE